MPICNEMLVSTYGAVCLTAALSALLQRELCIVVYGNVEEITRYKGGGMRGCCEGKGRGSVLSVEKH
jgi:hypothetical protein